MRQDNALHMMRKEINSYGKLSSNIGCFSTILCIKGILVNVAFNFSGAGHDIEFKEGWLQLLVFANLVKEIITPLPI